MNMWLSLAGGLSLLTCGVHVFAGGPGVHNPMLGSALHPVVKSVWSVVWHGATIVILLNSLAFFYAAINPQYALLISSYPIAVSMAFVVLFLFYGVTRIGSIWPMPQWLAFAAISVFAFAGLVYS